MKTAKELRTEIFELHTGTRPKAKDVMAKVDECLEQALKEQREICASFIPPREKFAGISGLVQNAPNPKL